MNNLTFTIDLVNGLLQYLGSRPYIETAGLIAEMHKQASDQGAAPVAVSIENSAE